MGLNLSFTCGGDQLMIPMGRPESEAVASAANLFPAECETLFGVDDFGKPREVASDALAAAAETLLSRDKEVRAASGVTYYLESEQSPGLWAKVSSGMQRTIDGVDHVILVGRDQCVIQKVTVGPDGLRVPGPPLDIRDKSEFRTDRGTVRIKRKTQRSVIAPLLRKIKDFAERHPGRAVAKTLG
jgi:hypothetical protein